MWKRCRRVDLKLDSFRRDVEMDFHVGGEKEKVSCLFAQKVLNCFEENKARKHPFIIVVACFNNAGDRRVKGSSQVQQGRSALCNDLSPQLLQ